MLLNMDKVIIKTENINKSFGDNVILSNINLSISSGEFVSIMGRSGSGKSTLLNILIGQQNPSSGVVLIDGSNINEMKDKDISSLKLNKIGFINQDPLLFEEFDVEENISLPLLIAGNLNLKSKALIYKYMEILGIADLKEKKIHQLSGGEKQRVSIVRALSMKPIILIADEPTGNLDNETKMNFMNLIKKIHHDLSLTTIIVTHDEEVSLMCDKHYIIKNQSLTSTS
jgi:ABC-type lipoprotein export system ATPase subunit